MKKFATGISVLILDVVAFTRHLIWQAHNEDNGNPDPNPEAALGIAALGDSFISGEGARHFLAGINTVGSNECRRARTAYPELVSEHFDAGRMPTGPRSSGSTSDHFTASIRPTKFCTKTRTASGSSGSLPGRDQLGEERGREHSK